MQNSCAADRQISFENDLLFQDRIMPVSTVADAGHHSVVRFGKSIVLFRISRCTPTPRLTCGKRSASCVGHCYDRSALNLTNIKSVSAGSVCIARGTISCVTASIRRHLRLVKLNLRLVERPLARAECLPNGRLHVASPPLSAGNRPLHRHSAQLSLRTVRLFSVHLVHS
jgi:hypothetical protein